jgi:hypothetical protein
MSTKRCECGWSFDAFGECSSCRVRKLNKLPAHAKCESCRNWKALMRCVNFGPNSVCAVWKEKTNAPL